MCHHHSTSFFTSLRVIILFLVFFLYLTPRILHCFHSTSTVLHLSLFSFFLSKPFKATPTLIRLTIRQRRYRPTVTEMKGDGVVVDDCFIYKDETHLTVLKTSLFFANDGFTVYDCKGQLVFRVDSYGPDTRDRDELVLMDALGKCLLTVRRKRPSLHQRWEGFAGERTDGQKPIFSVKRSSIIGRSSVTVEMYENPGEEYQIEGNFAQRCCTIFNAVKESVAEIRRKVDASTHVMLGKDVFSLCLKPGFDGAFAMGLVLVLDQINGVEDLENDGVLVDPVVPITED